MTTALPHDQIWFAVRWRRLWAVRREGNVAIAKYWIASMVSIVTGALVAAFAQPYVGLAVIVAGFGGAFFWFRGVQKRHTDYSVSYNDYIGARNIPLEAKSRHEP